MSYLTHFYRLPEVRRVANAGRCLSPPIAIDPRDLLDEPFSEGDFGANIERKLLSIYRMDRCDAQLCLAIYE